MRMLEFKKYFLKVKRTFLEEFSSVKLAVTLFIFLAITTLLGTILPEEPMVGTSELIRKYGPKKYELLKSLGLTDVFHSWWYLALLTSLGINIIVASFRRVFPKCKIAFSWPVELKHDKIKKLPVNCELEINDNLQLETIEKKLKEKKFQTRLLGDTLLAVKGRWHKLGASVTHIGIIILLIGSAISTLTGFNGMAQVSENEGFYLADLGQNITQVKSIEPDNWLVPVSKMPIWFGRIPPYLVKINKTWRENYKTGQPKQWYSDLSIFDQNKNELIRKTIHVNEPLEFMGLDVYQSNWGRFANLSFNNKLVTLPLESLSGEEFIFLPLSDDIALKLKIKSKKDILELYSIARDWNKEKYLGNIKLNQKFQLGPINIGYFGTETLTGLQFKSNPGGVLMYPGLVFIILGVLIAFGSRKQIWASINAIDNKIIIGGKSDRHKSGFYEEFEKLISELLNNK